MKKDIKEWEELDMSFFVWVWPITIIMSAMMVTPLYIAYIWLWIGNWVFKKLKLL